jgi:glycosyltransferase involved in cell wall biosynthesis
MKKPTIIITSPSIDISINVGGIAILTRLLVKHNNYVNYSIFNVGRKDSEKRNVNWVINQFLLIINFIRKLNIEKKCKIIHINIPLSEFSILINFVLVLISKLYKKNIIVHFRGGSLTLRKDIYQFQKFIINRCIKWSNKVIVLGNKEKMFLIDFYKIKDKKNIFVLPNSVEIPAFDKYERVSDNKPELLNLIFIGRIDKDKGLEEIISTLKSLKKTIDFRFYVAGSGPDQKEFILKCKEVLGDKFNYLGVLDNVAKAVFYKEGDVFILPSYFEGLPNALLEAMAYGVVPIVTPVGSIPEVVKDKINGFEVPIGDYNIIVETFIKLDNERPLLRKISKAAYQTIVNSYSIDNYINNLNNIYKILLINNNQNTNS